MRKWGEQRAMEEQRGSGGGMMSAAQSCPSVLNALKRSCQDVISCKKEELSDTDEGCANVSLEIEAMCHQKESHGCILWLVCGHGMLHLVVKQLSLLQSELIPILSWGPDLFLQINKTNLCPLNLRCPQCKFSISDPQELDLKHSRADQCGFVKSSCFVEPMQ